MRVARVAGVVAPKKARPRAVALVCWLTFRQPSYSCNCCGVCHMSGREFNVAKVVMLQMWRSSSLPFMFA